MFGNLTGLTSLHQLLSSPSTEAQCTHSHKTTGCSGANFQERSRSTPHSTPSRLLVPSKSSPRTNGTLLSFFSPSNSPSDRPQALKRPNLYTPQVHFTFNQP
eukprot:TRINITY_DN18444_c0_g1_i1.p2 TRINITY_DN18444_c0_g1~~TRINITY_DN18444_c0_g1_i1.p2  ORF type:complete len:102 (-),score=10.89 TRINITY_DN18444_c0_g1_i1:34-339(-)